MSATWNTAQLRSHVTVLGVNGTELVELFIQGFRSKSSPVDLSYLVLLLSWILELTFQNHV